LLQGKERAITLSKEEAETKTIEQIKKEAFKKEITEEQSTVRFIYQGKLLVDSAKVCDQNFKVNPYVHVILNKKDRPSNIESNNQANIGATGGLR